MVRHGGKRARAGRPQQPFRGHRVLLYVDDEAYQIHKRQVGHMNMSLEYVRLLKARYGNPSSKDLQMTAHKERLFCLQRERDEALRKIEEKYVLLIEQEAAIIKTLQESQNLEVAKEVDVVFSEKVEK